MTLKNKHEKATGKKLDDDLLVTLMMAKTQGPLQQHLRLNVDPATTFDQVLLLRCQDDSAHDRLAQGVLNP